MVRINDTIVMIKNSSTSVRYEEMSVVAAIDKFILAKDANGECHKFTQSDLGIQFMVSVSGVVDEDVDDVQIAPTGLNLTLLNGGSNG